METLEARRPCRGSTRFRPRRLVAWMRKAGDSWDFNWSQPVEEKGRLYRHRAFYTVGEYLQWASSHTEAL